jgi:hypothetical protein
VVSFIIRLLLLLLFIFGLTLIALSYISSKNKMLLNTVNANIVVTPLSAVVITIFIVKITFTKITLEIISLTYGLVLFLVKKMLVIACLFNFLDLKITLSCQSINLLPILLLKVWMIINLVWFLNRKIRSSDL